ncbi:MAG: thioesterase family protein [Elusimicrobia bacterium]|nr:thioesterase family protein [Elusimicrobiota bacterium]
MRKGLEVGKKHELDFKVTSEMRPARRDGSVVHPVYSTWSMVHHFEIVCRELLEPYLEEQEEAVGHELEVRHLAPAPLGASVRVQAVLEEIRHNRVLTAVEVFCGKRRIGEGRLVQVVLPKEKLQKRFREASET